MLCDTFGLGCLELHLNHSWWTLSWKNWIKVVLEGTFKHGKTWKTPGKLRDNYEKLPHKLGNVTTNCESQFKKSQLPKAGPVNNWFLTKKSIICKTINSNFTTNKDCKYLQLIVSIGAHSGDKFIISKFIELQKKLHFQVQGCERFPVVIECVTPAPKQTFQNARRRQIKNLVSIKIFLSSEANFRVSFFSEHFQQNQKCCHFPPWWPGWQPWLCRCHLVHIQFSLFHLQFSQVPLRILCNE